MELEVREVDSASRPKYSTRLDSYKAELKRLGTELKSKSTSHPDGLYINALICSSLKFASFQD